MKKTLSVCIFIMFIVTSFATVYATESIYGPTGVLYHDKAKSLNGYIVFAPMMGCKTTYMIDIKGNLVHKWDSKYPPGLYAELLPNGNLLRGGRIKNPPTTIGGASGIVQEIDWNGKVVWEYKMHSPTEVQHHTFDRMPNGNTLILGWEKKTIDEAIAKGRDPKTIPVSVFGRGKWHYDFWVDFVREVDKNGKTVWEWHVWDHIGPGPHQLDINFTLPKPVGKLYSDFDWTHFNTVGYIPEKDQVIMNSRNFSEIYIVDHKTGKMVYRWGNPAAYGQGRGPSWYDNGDQKIFGSHSAKWVGKNRVIVFDNGSERPEGNRSAAMEIDIKKNKIVWEYEAKHSTSFYSYRQGAVQRLPNGNTLITSTHNGHLIEVTRSKKVVWDYVSPVRNGKMHCWYKDGDGHNRLNNMIHRAHMYGADYPGLKGKDLTPKGLLADCPEFWKIYNTAGDGMAKY
ncbi:MAG: aryl-sulfate sulfotransferase [Deltaproteobacteria bacterium]|nr:aryl-sulfate sulfotransferase [Deltaproteobacteria bacterium]